MPPIPSTGSNLKGKAAVVLLLGATVAAIYTVAVAPVLTDQNASRVRGWWCVRGLVVCARVRVGWCRVNGVCCV